MKYLLSLLILFSIPLSGQELIINEVMSDNEEYISSFDGLHHDWIEIYNPTDTPIQLSSYYLSDDADEADIWQFPTATIEANEFMIIYASGLDTIVGNEIHTNFRINSDGEPVILSNINSEIVDSLNVPKLFVNDSYGNFTEENRVKTKLGVPTPGGSNAESGTLLFSHESGFYEDKIELEITAAPGAEIYYTIDGSIPDKNSRKYEGRIELKDEYEYNEIVDIPTIVIDDSISCARDWVEADKDIPRLHNLRFKSIKENEASPTITKSYIFHRKHQIPVMNISIPKESLFNHDTGIFIPGANFDISKELPCWTGNYFKRGRAWERNSHIAFFDKNKLEFEYNTGMRTHGGASRFVRQKSVKFYARSEYGSKKFEEKLFKDDVVSEYDNFLLRTSMVWDYSETVIKDPLTHNIVKDLNFDVMHDRPVALYINGIYWGYYGLRNRLDENYLAIKYDLNKDSINLCTPTILGHVENGSCEEYVALHNFIKNNDLTISENYKRVEQELNIENYIDYYLAVLFFNNTDWPLNNFKNWNYKGRKWESLFYDIDAGWVDHSYNMLIHSTTKEGEDYPNPPVSTLVFRKILQNDFFKQNFIDRAFELLETTFSTDNVLKHINKYFEKVENEIKINIKRWHYPVSLDKWKNDININLKEFAKQRPCAFRKHLVEFFDLSDDYLCDPLSVWKDSESEFEFYPNPTNDKVTIITIDQADKSELQILDVNGRILLEKNINSSRLEINIDHLSSGVYFIKFGSKMKKLIKL